MEEEQKVTVIKLTDEEKESMKMRLELIEKHKAAFGAVRCQYLVSERNMLDAIEKSESDYVSHIRMLSQMKKVPVDEEKWAFDPTALVFRKVIEDNQ
jgi:hypothetical protein